MASFSSFNAWSCAPVSRRKRRWRSRPFRIHPDRAPDSARISRSLVERRPRLLFLPGEPAQQHRGDGRVQRIARGVEPAEVGLHERRALLLRQEQIILAQRGADRRVECFGRARRSSRAASRAPVPTSPRKRVPVRQFLRVGRALRRRACQRRAGRAGSPRESGCARRRASPPARGAGACLRRKARRAGRDRCGRRFIERLAERDEQVVALARGALRCPAATRRAARIRASAAPAR